MFEIVTAINAKYEATAGLTLPGGLFYQHAPETVNRMPYGAYSVEGDRPDENTGAGYVEKVTVTFEIYAKKPLDLKAKAEAFRAAFYQQPLTLTAGRIIGADMVSQNVEDLETDDDTQPQVMYELVIEYTQTQTRG